MELRLAWRNVWRNTRRTGLTVAATVFAVVLVMFFVAMAAGLHEQMIEDAVRVNAGHIQVSGRGYLEKQTLEQFVIYDAALARRLDATRGVAGHAPRVASFGLLSYDSATRGVAVVGVDPLREASVSTLPERVTRGSFFEPDGVREIVLGGRLADVLSVGPGDEVLLYSIAYSLETAYDLFQVVGIMKLPEARIGNIKWVFATSDNSGFW